MPAEVPAFDDIMLFGEQPDEGPPAAYEYDTLCQHPCLIAAAVLRVPSVEKSIHILKERDPISPEDGKARYLGRWSQLRLSIARPVIAPLVTLQLAG